MFDIAANTIIIITIVIVIIISITIIGIFFFDIYGFHDDIDLLCLCCTRKQWSTWRPYQIHKSYVAAMV